MDQKTLFTPPRIDVMEQITLHFNEVYSNLLARSEQKEAEIDNTINLLRTNRSIMELRLIIINFLIEKYYSIVRQNVMTFTRFNSEIQEGIRKICEEFLDGDLDRFPIVSPIVLISQPTERHIAAQVQAIFEEYNIKVDVHTDIVSEIYRLRCSAAFYLQRSKDLSEENKLDEQLDRFLSLQDIRLNRILADKAKQLSDAEKTLHYWALTGNLKEVRSSLNWLSSNKTQLHQQDISSDKAVPLHYACQALNPEMIKCLLEAGTDPNVRDGYLYTPLHWILRITTYLETDREFLKRMFECLNLLVNAGAEIRAVDRLGRTLFHTAGYYGNYHGILWCIEKGLYINAIETDHPFMTPLTSAIDRGQDHVVALLIRQGASNTVYKTSSHTPMYFAAIRQNLNVAKLLQDQGFALTRTEREEFANQIKDRGYCGEFLYFISQLSNLSLQQFGLLAENPKFGPGYRKSGRKFKSTIDGRQINFVEYSKVLNDACYSLLNIDKNMLSHVMRVLSSNESVRNYIAPEIAEAVLISPYNFPIKYRDALQKLSAQYKSNQDALNTLIEHVTTKLITDPVQTISLTTMLSSLKTIGESQLVESILLLHNKINDVRIQMIESCKMQEIYELYFDKMIGHMASVIDPGFYSLIFWCQQNSINVMVWREGLSNRNNLLSLDENLSLYNDNASETIHVLVGKHCHDFNVLEVTAPKAKIIMNLTNRFAAVDLNVTSPKHHDIFQLAGQARDKILETDQLIEAGAYSEERFPDDSEHNNNLTSVRENDDNRGAYFDGDQNSEQKLHL